MKEQDKAWEEVKSMKMGDMVIRVADFHNIYKLSFKDSLLNASLIIALKTAMDIVELVGQLDAWQLSFEEEFKRIFSEAQ